jgi:hypothetical protein
MGDDRGDITSMGTILDGGRSRRHHFNDEVVLLSSRKEARTSAETAQDNSKGSARHSTLARSAQYVVGVWNTTPWDSENVLRQQLCCGRLRCNSRDDSVKQGAQTLVTQQEEDLRFSNWSTNQCCDLSISY